MASAAAAAAVVADDHDDEKDVCAICLEEPRVPYKLVNCVHKFCKSCLLQVREQTNNDPRCPLCRSLSFLAVSLVPGVGSMDLGHPSTERIAELKIDPADIVAAMVCVTCHSRDQPETLVQCDTCHALWHGTCTVEPILETRGDDGLPFPWTCAGCTARQRADNSEVRASMKAFFSARARAARARFQSDEPEAGVAHSAAAHDHEGGGGAGGRKYKRPVHSTKPKKKPRRNDDEENDVRFSGHDLGHGSENFFRRSAPLPRSPDAALHTPTREVVDVDSGDYDFDHEF